MSTIKVCNISSNTKYEMCLPEVMVVGFIRISQRELVNAHSSSDTATISNTVPTEVTNVCMAYYHDLQNIFELALHLFMDTSSSIQLDGNKYFLNIFLNYAQSNKNRQYIIDKQLIAILGHFYLGKNKSPYDNNWQYHAMDPQPDSSKLVELITILLRSCHTPMTHKTLNFFYQNQHEMADHIKRQWLQLPPTALSYKSSKANEYPRYLLHPLSEQDSKLPHCSLFYHEIIQQAHDNKDVLNALNNFIVHWSYEDKTYSEEMCRIIIEGIENSGDHEVSTYLAIMHQFIKINDTSALQQYRLQQLHSPNSPNLPNEGILELINKFKLEYRGWTYKCMKGVIYMMLDNEIYAEYMINKRDEWVWWDIWLKDFCIGGYLTDNEKKTFYQASYIPLLLKWGVKVSSNLI